MREDLRLPGAALALLRFRECSQKHAGSLLRRNVPLIADVLAATTSRQCTVRCVRFPQLAWRG